MAEVLQERARQEAKWGEQNHDIAQAAKGRVLWRAEQGPRFPEVPGAR
jgi:hypothetical protein